MLVSFPNSSKSLSKSSLSSSWEESFSTNECDQWITFTTFFTSLHLSSSPIPSFFPSGCSLHAFFSYSSLSHFPHFLPLISGGFHSGKNFVDNNRIHGKDRRETESRERDREGAVGHLKVLTISTPLLAHEPETEIIARLFFPPLATPSLSFRSISQSLHLFPTSLTFSHLYPYSFQGPEMTHSVAHRLVPSLNLLMIITAQKCSGH